MAVREVYEFGGFKLDAPERLLWRDGRCIPLAPKSCEVLLALVRNHGRLVTKRELLDLVWPEAFVEEGILSVHISALRKALEDYEGGRRYIETVPRAGYRFVAPVTRFDSDATPGQQSIAVLPAQPLLGEALSSENLATGLAIADALIDRLGRLPDLVIRPIRAVKEYAKTSDNPAAIGRALRVTAVVETSFVATAQQVKLLVKLIRSQDGVTLWTGSFDETATAVITIADSVAASVAVQLGAGFGDAAAPRSAMRPAANVKVYELLGRGRFHLLSASMFEAPKAVEAFRAAIELDPDYAPAYAGLALACCTQASLRTVPPQKAYQDAKAAALTALALDNACADAQLALGAVMFFAEWNWNASERSLKRALELNPNHSEAYLIYGQLLDAVGRLEEGLQMKLRALERDPFSPAVHLQISLSYWNQRRYDNAIEWAARALEIDPRHPHAREHLAGAYLQKGDFERYMAENLKHAELHGAPPEIVEELKRAFAEGGYIGLARLGLQRASNYPQAFPAMHLALLYGQTGSRDAAFRYLAQAIESRDPGLVHLAVGPQWDCLRADPRFHESLARMGLSPLAIAG